MELTQNQLKSVLHYNEETGVFTWISGHRKHKQAGHTAAPAYRTKITVFGKSYYAHRLAWLYVHGKFPALFIDHIDGNVGNNAIKNLREADRSQNQQNIKHAISRSRSKLLGAIPSRNKWTAEIVVRGKKLRLGMFNTALEAHAAYLSAKRRVHEFCTI